MPARYHAAAVPALGLALGLLVLMGPGADAHPPTLATPAAERAVVDEIVAFRKRLADAIRAKDAAGLRDMYFAGFTHTHTSAKLDGRDARIVSALAGEPVIETADVTDLVIRIPNDWTAIATGASPIVALSDGKTYRVHWTAVYVRTATSWQLAASHATRGAELKP
jgi:hypothetical protein